MNKRHLIPWWLSRHFDSNQIFDVEANGLPKVDPQVLKFDGLLCFSGSVALSAVPLP